MSSLTFDGLIALFLLIVASVPCRSVSHNMARTSSILSKLPVEKTWC